MDVHITLDQEAKERAALHALGCLEFAEARAFEVHLDECRACEREVAALRRVAEQLGSAAVAAEPPADLLARVRARIRTAPAAPPAMRYRFAEESAWQRLAVDGVQMRTLHVDEALQRATILVRMAPGASYPPHRHAGDEECYVLEGDLRIGDVTMQQGDYQHAPEGSRHVVQSTVNGCLLFITTSLHDEIEHGIA